MDSKNPIAKLTSRVMMFWKSLGFLAALTGILLLPSRLTAIKAAYPWLDDYLTPMNGLIVFSVVCVAYILWTDARPLFKRKPRPQPIGQMAAMMYNKAGSVLRDLAVNVARVTGEVDGVQAQPVDYFVHALTVMHGAGLVTLYGRRQPGVDLEPLPVDTFETQTMRIVGSNVTKPSSGNRVEWYDLHVPKPEAMKGLAEYEIDAKRQALNSRKPVRYS